MGAIHPGIPREHVSFLKARGGYTGLVETGTFEGATAEWAAGLFTQVHTVEASRDLFEAARLRLAPRTNVVPHVGRTQDVLRTLVPTLAGPWLFWLDAHWSAGNTYGAGDECPLLAELEIVLHGRKHGVLIDDARFFLWPPAAPHQWRAWPQIDALCEAVRVYSGGAHGVTIFEDVIWVLPRELHDAWCDYLHGLASRAAPSAPRRSALARLFGRR